MGACLAIFAPVALGLFKGQTCRGTGFIVTFTSGFFEAPEIYWRLESCGYGATVGWFGIWGGVGVLS